MSKIVHIHNRADVLGFIPLRQQVDIFTEWLELEDIRKFDSAACNSALRKFYLNLLLVECLAYPINSNEDLKNEFYLWSIKRRFKVTHFEMHDKMFTDHSFRHQYLQLTGRSLKSMSCVNVTTNVGEYDVVDEEEQTANDIATTQQIIYDLAELCPHLEVCL